jgi:multisubunit Na+/H+ antiporter MnhB subunit
MDAMGGWTTLAASVVLLAVTLTVLRERLPRRWMDGLVALSGAGVAVGGLLFLDDVGVASWVVAPLLLAVSAVAQWRLLFAPGGPLRT